MRRNADAEPTGSDTYSSSALPEWYDEGIARGIKFNDIDPLNFTGVPLTMTNFVSVYEARGEGQQLFNFGTFTHLNDMTLSVRTNCRDCRHYEDNAWKNSIDILFLHYLGNGYQWSTNKRLMSMDGFTGTENLQLGNDFSGGVIYEVVIFSSTPSPATLDKVYDYLAIKHQVDFDGPASVGPAGL